MDIQGNEFSVSKIFIHASYNQPKFANDIAIIELDTADDDNKINDAVCFPEFELQSNKPKSTIAVVKRTGGSLKFGKAVAISANECSSFFNQQFTELKAGQFCANVQSNDTEFSPFIGAIVIESDRNRQYTFKGFTSTAIRSEQAFDESKPYILTNLAHYLNWIRAAIGNELKRKPEPQLPARVEDSQNLTACQMSSGDGYCVKLNQCTLFRDAPQPLSTQRQAFLDQIKCFTDNKMKQSNLSGDGVCCPIKYIQSNITEAFNVDQRRQGKKGVELLDLKKCGQVDASRRIVGGSKAGLKEFSWIGLIKYRFNRIFKFTCGSSLISSRYVLTCAHCITNLPPNYQVVAVRLGEYDRTTDPDCKLIDENEKECNPPAQDIPVETLIPHPNYNNPRYANDVGVVRLAVLPDLSQGSLKLLMLQQRC